MQTSSEVPDSACTGDKEPAVAQAADRTTSSHAPSETRDIPSGASASAALLWLPSNVLGVHIASRLAAKDLVNTMLACRSWYSAMATDDAWAHLLSKPGVRAGAVCAAPACLASQWSVLAAASSVGLKFLTLSACQLVLNSAFVKLTTPCLQVALCLLQPALLCPCLQSLRRPQPSPVKTAVAQLS